MVEKTAIITGASSGIGKAIAKLFLDRGYRIVMNSRNDTGLRQAFLDFGSPGNARMVAGDIGAREVGERLAAAAMEHFGSLDVLINNAGIFAPKPFLDVEERELEAFLRVNLMGAFFASQAAVKRMIANGGGAIVNIGTVLVDHAIAGFPASAPVASKGALHALTRQLAAEFGDRNIRVNTIAPGIIRSPLQGKIGIADPDGLAGLHLLGRIGEPADIAEMAYALATNGFITGTLLPVDGGHLAGHRFA